MYYKMMYESPLGPMILAASDIRSINLKLTE